MAWTWANIDWTTTGTLAAAWVQAVGSIAAVAGAAWVAVWTASEQRRRDQEAKADLERRVDVEAAEAMMLVSNAAGAGAAALILMVKDLEGGEDVMQVCGAVVQGMSDLHEEAVRLIPLQIPGHGGRSYASLVTSGIKSAMDGGKILMAGMRDGLEEEEARSDAILVLNDPLERLRDCKNHLDQLIATKVPHYVPVDLERVALMRRGMMFRHD